MPLPPADRALRRLVADLAMATPDDIDAVLDRLDPGQRARVQALLDVFRAEPERAGLPPRPALSTDDVQAIDGLSPWLAARLTGVSEGMGSFAMTPAALTALNAVAASLQPPSRTVTPTLRTPSLGDMVQRLMSGRRS